MVDTFTVDTFDSFLKPGKGEEVKSTANCSEIIVTFVFRTVGFNIFTPNSKQIETLFCVAREIGKVYILIFSLFQSSDNTFISLGLMSDHQKKHTNPYSHCAKSH